MNFRTHSFILILFLLMCLSGASAQEPDTIVVSLPDSAVSDTVLSPAPIIPIPQIGSLDRARSLSAIIPDSVTYFNEYGSANDIVINHTGSFLRDLGSIGQNAELTLGGLGGKHVAYFHDGILLNEPLTGTYNPSWMQTEEIGEAEIITGTQAFLHGLNSTAGAINAVSRHYKAIRPLTKIRYSESRYEQTFFDGMFSQNLTRNFNLTGGVQRYVTDGRFRNSDYDMWGARIRARYDISNRLNFFFSEHYTQTQLGLFGGVDYNATAALTGLFFVPLQAQVVTGDVYEKITRHDLQFGVAARLSDDSTDITSLTAYYSTHFRELRDENNRENADTFYTFDDHLVRWQGVKLTRHVDGGRYSFNLGGEVQSRQVVESPATDYRAQVAANASGKLELSPFERLQLAGYFRFDNYLARTTLSHGADASFSPFGWLRLYGGYSQSVRFPTFQELYWRRGNIIGPAQQFQNERHLLIEGGIEFEMGTVLLLDMRVFRRTVENPIVALSTGSRKPFTGVQFSTLDQSTYEGINVTGRLRAWHIEAEGDAHYLSVKHSSSTSIPGGLGDVQPEWWASGGLYYRNALLDDKLDLKVGIRGRAWGKQSGVEFNPEAMVFVPSSLPPLGIATVADAVLIARIGGAYVHLIWQNLLDHNYVVVPFYPMPDRAVRFGITWQLLD